MPGVLTVVTADSGTPLSGTLLEDRPLLALGKVRYYGEPVAVVVAHSELAAKHGADVIEIEYQPLPVVNSISDALKPGAPLIHERLDSYRRVKPWIYPVIGSNISDQTFIRKGNMEQGWAESEVTVEAEFSMPQIDHAAMETRSARAEIMPDGRIIISTASQSPYIIRKLMSRYFKVEKGKVIVNTPMVGGSFGGKAAIQLELIAYMASKAVQGRPVKITNTRKQDITSSPVKIGLEARLKLGASRDGRIKAAEFKYYIDHGAYSDMGAVISKSIGSDCSGPYNIENLSCEVLAVYTNHPYTTSFRGFGHAEYTFCIERLMDKLAYALGIDPLDLRLKNAISPGNTSPTQVKITYSNTGNLAACLTKLREQIGWDEGERIDLGNGKIRAKGLACLWKTPSTPHNARAGAILTFCPDGSLNLNVGSVEMGQGSKTGLAQIVSERLKMDISKIHVIMEVNTQLNPEYWKTVASGATFMVGRAVIAAADDVIRQLREIAAVALRCAPDDLEVGGERVFLRADPSLYLEFKDIVEGYKYPNGNAIGGQIIGRGNFIAKHLTALDFETGRGKSGLAWAVGAQAVEVEYDTRYCTYKVLRAAIVLDAGKVINPQAAKGVVMGGMCMGLGIGTREELLFNGQGIIENPEFNLYKLMRFGENPEYLVDFVETPQLDSAYGARGIGEHGIIGIPAALGNALSRAAEVELNQLPLTPEQIWTKVREKSHDPVRL